MVRRGLFFFFFIRTCRFTVQSLPFPSQSRDRSSTPSWHPFKKRVTGKIKSGTPTRRYTTFVFYSSVHREISDPSTFSSNPVPPLEQHVSTVDGTHPREKINAGNKKNWTRTRASESQRSPLVIINIESIRRLKNVNAHHPHPCFFLSFFPFPSSILPNFFQRGTKPRIRLTFHSIPAEPDSTRLFLSLSVWRKVRVLRTLGFPTLLPSVVLWIIKGGGERDVAIICFSEIFEIFAGGCCWLLEKWGW